MKRKFVALLLAVACLMAMAMGTVSAAPAEAFEYTLTVDEQGNIIEPKASVSLSCGLNKVSGSTYYAWASASGDNTLLSVSVYLYKGNTQLAYAASDASYSAIAETRNLTLSPGEYTVRGYVTYNGTTDGLYRDFDV